MLDAIEYLYTILQLLYIHALYLLRALHYFWNFLLQNYNVHGYYFTVNERVHVVGEAAVPRRYRVVMRRRLFPGNDLYVQCTYTYVHKHCYDVGYECRSQFLGSENCTRTDTLPSTIEFLPFYR